MIEFTDAEKGIIIEYANAVDKIKNPDISRISKFILNAMIKFVRYYIKGATHYSDIIIIFDKIDEKIQHNDVRDIVFNKVMEL